MDLEALGAKLALLKAHGVVAAEFDEGGDLRKVQFILGGGEVDSGDDETYSQFRTAMHNAAGVLQGRHRSMREEGNHEA